MSSAVALNRELQKQLAWGSLTALTKPTSWCGITCQTTCSAPTFDRGTSQPSPPVCWRSCQLGSSSYLRRLHGARKTSDSNMEEDKRDIKWLLRAEHDRLCGVSVLVWADISYDGSKDLYVIRNGSLNSVRYMNEIIARIVGSPLVTISFWWATLPDPSVQECSTSIWKRKQSRGWIGQQKHLTLFQWIICMEHPPGAITEAIQPNALRELENALVGE